MTPPWIGSLHVLGHMIIGAIPALLVVLFGGILAILALGCGPARRDYALSYTDRCIDLAAVLTGAPRRRT
jgi:hypothetical protein